MSGESLDWSDPSKLMRRDGGEVLAKFEVVVCEIAKQEFDNA